MTSEKNVPFTDESIASFGQASFDSCKLMINVTHIGSNYGPLYMRGDEPALKSVRTEDEPIDHVDMEDDDEEAEDDDEVKEQEEDLDEESGDENEESDSDDDEDEDSDESDEEEILLTPAQNKRPKF